MDRHREARELFQKGKRFGQRCSFLLSHSGIVTAIHSFSRSVLGEQQGTGGILNNQFSSKHNRQNPYCQVSFILVRETANK